MENKDFKSLVESYSKIYEKTQSEVEQVKEGWPFGPDTVKPQNSPSGTKSVEVGKKYPALQSGQLSNVTYDRQGNKSVTPMTGMERGVAALKMRNTGMSSMNPQARALMNQSYEPEGDQIDELNAGPSTPVKYDSHMNQLVPNQGAGRPGEVRIKKPLLQQAGYEPEGEMVDESDIGDRARKVVGDQRSGVHGDADAMKQDMDAININLRKLRGFPNGFPSVQKNTKKTTQVAHYEPEGEMVDEGKQPFPAKKVAKQMEKARQGSVYGRKTENKPNPNVSDSEKKNTTRFSKMFHASEKAKREKQDADKASRSSTFYRDTHPASAPQMKKANEEVNIFDTILEYLISEGYAETNENAIAIMSNMSEEWRESIVELNRVEREQGKKSGGSDDQAFRMVKKSIRKMEGTPAGQRKKVPGAKPPKAGEYGGPRSPAQKVAMRRAAAQRSQDNMSSRFD